MSDWMNAVRTDWRLRPWWMNMMFYFCMYMTVIYMPFDFFFKPVEVDQEVWFGFMLTGWWAKATEPLHWLIYGAGAYGFWRMKTWMWPWAALYAGQVVIAMLVWNLMEERGTLIGGIISGAVFMIPTIALWRAKPSFQAELSDSTDLPA